MIYTNETIAAIATSLNPSGIGIIRISGENAIEITDRIFISKKNKKLINVKSHTLNYGTIIDPRNDHPLDEVLVSVMRGPYSYTKEDVVEINCHGGSIVLKKVLKLAINQGARLADPGEFTKRAFLNGRIDLSQAEAVIDIINSKTDMALESSVSHLKGSLSIEVKKIMNDLLGLIAHIEASIDYPEYDIEELEENNIKNNIKNVKKDINNLLFTYDNGKIIHEGIQTVLVGKPNVGKSSLLNNLLKEQRAIVTDIPGTTRDILEEYMNVNGIPLKLIDTAGIRETKDIVEKIGVDRTRENIQKADLVIFIIDSSNDLSEEDEEIYKMIQDKKSIILLNKIDLGPVISKEYIEEKFDHSHIIPISIKDNHGIEDLVKKIEELFMLNDIHVNDQVYITNMRHKIALENAIQSIDEVMLGLDNGMPVDCLAIDIKNIYDYLSELTGESVNEDIISQIFSQFCLGK